MKNLSVFESQIEKHYPYKEKTYYSNSSIVAFTDVDNASNEDGGRDLVSCI